MLIRFHRLARHRSNRISSCQAWADWPRNRSFSGRPPSASDGTQDRTFDDDDSSPPPSRNKALAGVIRQGIAYLNASAAQIQASRHTKKALLPEAAAATAALEESSERQRSEENRILTVATDCLEEMSRANPILCIQGEPIMLMAVRVKRSLRVATLYWALPFHVTMDETMTKMQKHYLEYKIAVALEETGGILLQRRVQAVLRGYYPPRLKFEPAPPVLRHEALQDMDMLDNAR